MTKEILAIKDNPITCAAALVAATLLYDPTDFLKFLYLKDGKFCFIEPLKENSQEKVFDLKNEKNKKNEKVIFVSEDDLKKYLSKMRDQEFNGAVLVFSTKDFSTLKKDYPILKAAKGSHEALFQSPLDISSLLTKVNSLRSILTGNMRHLKYQIEECKKQESRNFDNAKQALKEYTSNQQPSSKQKLDTSLETIARKYPETDHDIKLRSLPIDKLSSALENFQNKLSQSAENPDM